MDGGLITSPKSWAQLRPWAQPLALFGLASIALLVGVRAGSGVPIWDEDAVDYYRLSEMWSVFFRTGDLESFKLAWHGFGIRPPAFLLWAGAVLAALGDSPTASIVAQLLSLLVLTLTTFDLGRRMQSREAAFLAAAFVCACPVITVLSRGLMMEVPLAAAVALSAWTAWALRSFRHRFGFLLLGIPLGIGCLVKWVFPIFAGPPVLAVLILELTGGFGSTDARWSPPAPPSRIVLNAALTVLVMLGVAATWYVPAMDELLPVIQDISYGDSAASLGSAGRDQLREHLFYPTGILSFIITVPVAILAAPGLLAFVRRVPIPVRVFVLMALLVPAAAYHTMLNKQIRFLPPIVPFVGLAIGIGMQHMVRTGLRRPLTLGILGICAINLVAFTATRSYLPPMEESTAFGPLEIQFSPDVVLPRIPIKVALNLPTGDLELLTRRSTFWLGQYARAEDQMEELTATLLAALDQPQEAQVVVLPWEVEIWTTLWFLSEQDNLGFSVASSACFPELVADADVVVDSTMRTPVGGCDVELGAAEFASIREQFRLAGTFARVDGSSTTVWVRQPRLGWP
jgi:4-amino-4-deoxy-L-arabinose transferase-like glycosyltransferase